MAEKNFQHHFQRFETKYIISKETLLDLLLEFEGYLVEDERAYSTINNLYYDTPSYQLIRESLENPCFDEKVRLRTYQEHLTEDSQVFLEIKKKTENLVTKRCLAADRYGNGLADPAFWQYSAYDVCWLQSLFDERD